MADIQSDENWDAVQAILDQGGWNTDMNAAPRDGTPILVWHAADDRCGGGKCGERTNGRYHLCLFHAHVDGLYAAEPGYNVAVWGGGWADTGEYGEVQAELEDWWFVRDSEFERVTNPVAWQPLPAPFEEVTHEHTD